MTGRFILILLLSVGGAFWSGGTTPWSQAGLLTGLGLLLLLFPPRNVPPMGLAWCGAALALLSFFPLLPDGWNLDAAWRLTVVKDLHIILPDTISPQPWLTAERIPLLFGGIAWCVFLFAVPFSLRDQMTLLRWYAVGVALYAGLTIFFHYTGTTPAIWHSTRDFGSFPNRNQTGNFLALGSIVLLALTHEAWQKKRGSWPLWGASLLLVGFALVLNYSRAGILLFFVGSVVWMLWLLRLSSRPSRLVILVAGMMTFLSLFFLFGGETLGRFMSTTEDVPSGLSSDFRWILFQETSVLGRESSWFGNGLGSFSTIFPFYRDQSLSPYRVLHPESDWLWLWIEMGPAAVVIVGLAVYFSLTECLPMSHGSDRRLRAACIVAGGAFVLHAFWDVAGHRLGSFLPAVLLIRLGATPQFRPAFSPEAAWGFRAMGLFLLLLPGVAQILNLTGRIDIPGSVAVDRHLAAGWAAVASVDSGAAIDHANTALKSAPLDWRIYYLRATAALLDHAPQGGIMADFRRVRALEPGAIELRVEEGRLWLQRSPSMGLFAWQEALELEPEKQRAELYFRILGMAGTNRFLRQGLKTYAERDPDLWLYYLETASKDEFNDEIVTWRLSDPNFERLGSVQQEKLFQVWSKRGDREQLSKLLESDEKFRRAGWLWLAGSLADSGQYEEAYAVAAKYAQPPVLPEPPRERPPVETLARALILDPKNIVAGITLYHIYKEEGRNEEALAALQKMIRDPACPPYIHYLAAGLYAERREFESAWKAWKQSQVH